ncbi:MAG: hypothetical protein JO157_18185 [Acetobacteraceae bacterium]|nr:hypothetical protein [Acetobacteraceae bacterium]
MLGEQPSAGMRVSDLEHRAAGQLLALELLDNLQYGTRVDLAEMRTALALSGFLFDDWEWVVLASTAVTSVSQDQSGTASQPGAAGRPALKGNSRHTGATPSDDAVATWLVAAAPRWFRTSSEPWDILRAMRPREPKLVPTWFSALAVSGVPLSAAGSAELAATRRRQDYYLDLAAELTARFPDLRLIKGPLLVQRYPAGLVRHLGDLDAVLPDEERVYELGSWLLGRGWRRYSLAAQSSDGRRDLLLTLVCPAPCADQPILAVQLSTLEMAGNLMGIRPMARLATQCDQARCMLSLIAERVERPFELRDLLDAVVLLDELQLAGMDELASLLQRTSLAPEARELQSLLARFAPQAAALPAVSVPQARWRRLAGTADGMHQGPGLARAMQHVVAYRSPPAALSAVLRRSAERLTAQSALQRGGQVWGRPVAEADRAAVGALLPGDVITTPVGDWVMAPSPELPARIERALRRARSGSDEPAC